MFTFFQNFGGGGQADTHSTPFPLTYGYDPIYVKAKLNPWFDPDISTNPALKEGKEKIGRTNNEKSDFWAKCIYLHIKVLMSNYIMLSAINKRECWEWSAINKRECWEWSAINKRECWEWSAINKRECWEWSKIALTRQTTI